MCCRTCAVALGRLLGWRRVDVDMDSGRSGSSWVGSGVSRSSVSCLVFDGLGAAIVVDVVS